MEPHPTVPTGTPIVVVSIDTLRADRLPAYGYRAVDTPAIDALRRDAILFERAYSNIPLTLPSHASLLSGMLPGSHGVRDNMGYTVDPAKVPMLQGLLRERSYATGAFVSAYVLRGTTGISAGFDVYEDSIEYFPATGVGSLQRSGEETARLAVDWLGTVSQKPFFLFVHFFEPHTPYEPPEPYRSRYGSPYDGEIAAADAATGLLLDGLRRLGVYDRAVVVLLSDHGEGLGEHGEQEHGIFLYRTTLQVPLMIKLPGAARGGTSVAEPVQLLDVAPTLLALLGQKPPGPVEGSSLLGPGGARERRPIYSETFYPRLHFGWSELASVILGREHWIEAPAPERYDLVADPGETRNLVEQDPRLADELHRTAQRHHVPLAAPEAVDEETRQRLAALGYLGGAGNVFEGSLPDPKSQGAALAAIREAFDRFAARDYAAAEPLLRRVLEANPRMLDAWDAFGRTLEARSKLPEALAAYQEGLRVSGGSAVLALSAARLLFRLGHLDEAEESAKLAFEGGFPSASELLTRVMLQRRRLDDATHWARVAVENRGTRLAPLIIQGEVLLALGHDAEALTLTDQVVEEFNRRSSRDTSVLRGAALLRGRIFAGRGDADRALAAFRQEIALFPDQLAAYTHVAILFAALQRPEEARAVLRGMVAANPDAGASAEAVRTLRVLGDRTSASRVLDEARRRFPGDPRLSDAALAPAG